MMMIAALNLALALTASDPHPPQPSSMSPNDEWRADMSTADENALPEQHARYIAAHLRHSPYRWTMTVKANDRRQSP